MTLHISYDENLIAHMQAKFDLREPNVEALKKIVTALESGDYNPHEQLVLDLATGVGKTYIMAALIEYLRRQGMTNVMIVTPNKVVHNKTVADFSQGSNRYIGGFDAPPTLITPSSMGNLRLGDTHRELFAGTDASNLYVFNVQQLFPPKDGGTNEATGDEAQRRKTWRFQEETGALAEHLIDLDDLVVIVDEAHLFTVSAKRFQESLTAFDPAAIIGLTASASDHDNVIYHYPLWRAIQDRYVKQPVLVYRKSGYDSEERQLHDAIALLKIKQEAYATYRQTRTVTKQTEPLLFVVCSDVNHATETAQTLRHTYFTGPSGTHAVLQVDNQHDDATTQALLRNLDEPGSPVKVIVSVNKLREGWDTKRIAVMCTLRAMGSEVLTQQVMGRGLRLPFGTITDVDAIDELDIISHKSFVSLLKSENVLQEFGIEDGNVKVDPKKVFIDPDTDATPGARAAAPAPTHDHFAAPQAGETPELAPMPSGCGNAHPSGSTCGDPSGSIAVRGLTDQQTIEDDAPAYNPVVVEINEKLKDKDITFLFPSSAMTETTRPFSLADIDDQAVAEAARKITDGKETLERQKINAEITAGGTRALVANRQDSSKISSYRASESSVEKELIKAVMATRRVHATQENSAVLSRRLVPLFMEKAGIERWTEKAKQSAIREISALVKAQEAEAARANTSTEVKIHPVRLPVRTTYALPEGKTVENPLGSGSHATDGKPSQFRRDQHYGPWKRCLFSSASFDSFSAEYELARKLNYDDDVQWWTRIYPSDRAQIAYTPRNNYIPDFVVLDSDNTHWIIEGKANNQRDDETVIKKREATERVLRTLVAHPDFQNEKWAYMIAFEDDIENSESLEDLKARCVVERMLPSP